LLAGTTQGRRRVCFFTVWFGFWLRERQREEENRFMGLLLNFFSPSHGLSLSRSDSLCLSARESKGKNGKEGEQRRKKKEGESCCGLEEKHRRWRVSASSSFLFFFSAEKLK
jgi:hypothetical protein